MALSQQIKDEVEKLRQENEKQQSTISALVTSNQQLVTSHQNLREDIARIIENSTGIPDAEGNEILAALQAQNEKEVAQTAWLAEVAGSVATSAAEAKDVSDISKAPGEGEPEPETPTGEQP